MCLKSQNYLKSFIIHFFAMRSTKLTKWSIKSTWFNRGDSIETKWLISIFMDFNEKLTNKGS